jgi:MoaA/NifB/PqqE/SkfB family radical SAM enzyme
VNKIAEKLAASPVRNLWISIDSVDPAVHEQMRGFPKLISGIERALPIFHRHGIYPSANLGINRAVGGANTSKLAELNCLDENYYLRIFYLEFKKAFREFYRFVADLGFTMVNTCYPMSIDPTEDLQAVYGATSADPIVRFSKAEKALLYKALLETIPEFRSQLRIFSPQCSLYALYQQYSSDSHFHYPCRGGIDFFFIDSKDGNTYPCGYRGNENFGRYWELNCEVIGGQRDCHQCDWECFRDPSELFGPILQGLSDPFSLLKRLKGDRRFFRLWLDDLRYYRACDLFDGRKPPDYKRMRGF